MNSKKLINLTACAIIISCLVSTFSTRTYALGYDVSSHPNTHINTGNYATDIVQVALTQVGYHETPLLGDYTKYNDWYFGEPDQKYAWCSIFISWCANQAGIPEANLPKNLHAYYATYDNYENSSYFGGSKYSIDNAPSSGDLFFSVTSADTDYATHAGIVWKVEDGYVYTIEGNTHFYDSVTKSWVGYVENRMYDVNTGYQYYPNSGNTSTYCHILFYVHPDYEGKLIAPEFGTSPEITPSTKFTDVPANTYYAIPVTWAANSGIAYGTTSMTFSPEMTCTRAQAVTFLYRSEGYPEDQAANIFTDVDDHAYYANAVMWAISKGVTMGTSETTFSPDKRTTRGEYITFLYRLYLYYHAYSPSGSSTRFADVSQDAYYADAVSWAYDYGVSSGVSSSQFAPNSYCSRADAVTFLYRYALLG